MSKISLHFLCIIDLNYQQLLNCIRIYSFIPQGRILRGTISGQPRASRSDVRRQDNRQEGAQGQGRLAGERDQSAAQVRAMNPSPSTSICSTI